MKARAFDEKFDKGESVLRHLDLSKAVRPGSQQRRVNVDFPVWMIESLDKEEIGPKMLIRISKHTGLKPEDL